MEDWRSRSLSSVLSERKFISLLLLVFGSKCFPLSFSSHFSTYFSYATASLAGGSSLADLSAHIPPSLRG